MTPLQQQYNKIKAQHPDTILFFRMGDFYEGFDEDAKIMAKVLGITLTSRNKSKDEPMAGIPHHSIDSYLYKMVVAGYKVAICEQLEDPKASKGIVKRGVIKVVTPGTITDEKAIDITSNNYIAAINFKENLCSISYSDINTGEFKTTEINVRNEVERKKVIDEINRISPSEILLIEESQSKIKQEYKPLLEYYIQYLSYDYFNEEDNYSSLIEFFKTKNLKGFGIENRKLCISTSGALIKYLKETQKNELTHINNLQFFNLGDQMLLDSATMQNLELIFSTSGNKKASLIGVLNQTQTTMGARMLRSWILQPLINKEKIEERINAVDLFVQKPGVNDDSREILSQIYDLERLSSKLGSLSANPKDLVSLKTSLAKLPELSEQINKLDLKNSTLLSRISKEINTENFNELIEIIEKSINDNPPTVINEGGIIKNGYNSELDEIRDAALKGKEWIKKLQSEEISKTGISSLKVKFNNVFGYFIEVSKSNLDKVPEEYIRKQTLVNCERFFTPELKEMEKKILGAQDKMVELEYKLFSDIRNNVAKYITQIQKLANQISILDIIANFAYIARYNDYIKPVINENGMIDIKDGRHPVVENLTEDPFIPNDVELDESKKIIILTGPNMSGKSTYIRQVAIIVLMAQIGCFVPARSAEIFVTDRIFTRVGASDNLSAGESTFMVEMNETANILNNATERSLIILDEVGRGTSTYDGVSIAWAIAEYLHNELNAYTLFATHYHELIKLEQILDKVKNYNVAVKEDGESVTFLRKIIEGGTDQSYGVHVAELAGLPKSVINKAKEILSGLEQESMFEVSKANLLNQEDTESEKQKEESNKFKPQLDFFATKIVQNDPKFEEIKKKLRDMDINNMTPIEAMKKLGEMKKTLE